MPGQTYSNRTLIGQAPLEADHSLKVLLPGSTPLILELVDGATARPC